MATYFRSLWRWLFPNPILVPTDPGASSTMDNTKNSAPSQLDDSHADKGAGSDTYPLPTPTTTPPLFALLIGINTYASVQIENLDGPVADVAAMKNYLETNLGVSESQIRVLLDEAATKTAIIQAFQALREDERIKHGDPILIYYSGHGGRRLKSEGWESDGPTIQMLLPHDYRLQPTNIILDRVINVLLEKLANEKGDNITVIFDCCHSASGTRKTGSNRRSRGIEVTESIPEDLDKDILVGSRAADIPSEFAYNGLRSHVLLAACSQNERAMEENSRGVFTVALIDALVAAGAGRVTYSDLLMRLPSLPQQTPQCEGLRKNRILFDAKAPDLGFSFHKVCVEGNEYTLQAGAAHGITDGAEFAIYQKPDDFYRNYSLGNLIVQKADMFFSRLVARQPVSGEPMAPSTSIILKGDAYALQTMVGVDEDLSLHVADPALRAEVANNLSTEKDLTGPKRRRFILVDKEKARLSVDIKGESIVFSILNPLVAKFGLDYMPFKVTRDSVPSVLQAAAHFDWHLRRTPTERMPFQQHVHLEFTKVIKKNGRIQVEGENLNIDGNIDIVVGPSTYGLKLTNDSDSQLYPYLFFFDCSDLSVEFYYDSATGQEAEDVAPLQPHRSITIGYGAGGWAPWRYSLRNPKKFKDGQILQEKQDIDVGFLKLFLSTTPLELAHMEQQSPFLPPFNRGYRGGSRMPFEAVGWDATLITVVQRREELPVGDDKVPKSP